MKTTNKYGFVSGGWIFDYMDRAALNCLNVSYPETRNQNFYTAKASVNFLSQVCDTKDISADIRIIPHGKWGKSYSVITYLRQGNIRRAEGVFLFVKAKENKCETKGKQNEQTKLA